MTRSAGKKVVNLGDFGQTRQASGAAARVLRECRALAVKRLQQHMARLMEHIDDALFARAEKAENNVAQTRYFDAMREMRIIRKDIEEDFISRFQTRFDAGIPRTEPTAAGLPQDGQSNDEGDFGLVEQDDLEQDLAIANMVNKLRGTCVQSLYALDRRIGLLLRDPDLERWQNPLGPEAVCQAFKAAAGRIETGIEIRLVVFKLFDQHVVNQLDALYREINQQLIGRGVLPEIKATIRKSATATHPAPGAVQAGSDRISAEAGAGSTGVYAGQGQPDPLAGRQHPIHTLTFLQQGNLPLTAPDVPFSAEAIDQAGLVSGTVNVLHGIKQSGLTAGLDSGADVTIDIVAMLFDYILDDRSIPDPLRALIGRLQIPVLKVALLDRDFFARKSHPARQLLNRLSATAVSWNEDDAESDALFGKIEAIVQTILDEFEDDIGLFAGLLADFETFLEREQQQAQIRAERSARVMEGQERLQVAKSTTLEEIGPRVDDRQNLDFVRRFVSDHWKNLLFITCARHGKDSPQWQQAVATMDDLIWSVRPKLTVEDRKKLVALQPGLLQRLREGMERLSLPATERDAFIARLVRAHGRTALAEDAATTPQDSASGTAAAGDYRDFPPAVLEKTAEEQAVPLEAVAGEDNDATEYPDIDDAHAERARNLKPGTWIEFTGDDGKRKRAKLSWISPITGTYLFTDREGLKAGNLGIAELAHHLRYARARVLDNTPPLERAVTTALKHYANNKPRHPQ